eukprot:jgi/Chrzof1/3823/Cz13g10040.t1
MVDCCDSFSWQPLQELAGQQQKERQAKRQKAVQESTVPSALHNLLFPAVQLAAPLTGASISQPFPASGSSTGLLDLSGISVLTHVLQQLQQSSVPVQQTQQATDNDTPDTTWGAIAAPCSVPMQQHIQQCDSHRSQATALYAVNKTPHFSHWEGNHPADV